MNMHVGKTALTADPAFAAVREARAAMRRTLRLADRLEAAEHAAYDEHGRPPFVLIAWRNYSAIGGGELERARDHFLQNGLNREQVEAEYQDAKQRYRKALKGEYEWYAQAGLREQWRNLENAKMEDRAAHKRLAKVRPTTPAGAAAMLDYLLAEMKIGEADWHHPAIRNIAAALGDMGQPPDSVAA